MSTIENELTQAALTRFYEERCAALSDLLESVLRPVPMRVEVTAPQTTYSNVLATIQQRPRTWDELRKLFPRLNEDQLGDKLAKLRELNLIRIGRTEQGARVYYPR